MSKQKTQYLKPYDDIDLNTLNKEIFHPYNDLYDLDINLIIETINNTDKKLKKIEQAQKQEKLLDMYREYFRLNSVPKGEWTTLIFNRLLEVQNIIKELENEN